MNRQLRAGVAKIEITPPTGLDLSGFIARTNPCISVRDPLYARALVFDDGSRQIGLVVADLLGLSHEDVQDIRQRVALATGMAQPTLMVAATHTHGGPATMFLQGCGEPDEGYFEEMERRVAQAVVQAQDALRPVRVYWGEAQNRRGVHNRRVEDGPIDPTVELLRCDELNGEPLALLVNYACHPTTLNHINRAVSADYPGLVTEQLEQETGATTLFLTGAIGNVGPIERGEESLKEVAQGIINATRDALPTLTQMDAPGLDTEGELLHLSLLPIPEREQWYALRAQYETERVTGSRADDPVQARMNQAMLDWSSSMVEKVQRNDLSPQVEAEVQLLRIGDCAIVGVPGELFVELGLAIKQQGALPQVMIAGFANGNIGYIPTRDAYAAGGYEVESAYRYYGYPAALAPEAGEMIVRHATQLIRQSRLL